jgi:hypothetical protein
MAHSVSEQAARAVKNSEKVIAEKRTPEEILKTIRGNIAAHLFVTPNDQRWLLEQYDSNHALMVQTTNLLEGATNSLADAYSEVEKLKALISDMMYEAIQRENDRQAEHKMLLEKIEQFRTVYEQENSFATVKVERSIPESDEFAEPGGEA